MRCCDPTKTSLCFCFSLRIFVILIVRVIPRLRVIVILPTVTTIVIQLIIRVIFIIDRLLMICKRDQEQAGIETKHLLFDIVMQVHNAIELDFFLGAGIIPVLFYGPTQKLRNCS